MKRTFFFLIAAAAVMAACERLDDNHGVPEETESPVRPEQLAMILSEIDLGKEQLWEVHDAVTSSSGNGYDEEYTMSDLFASPGAGVGDTEGTKAGKTYARPLRELIQEYLLEAERTGGTKAAGEVLSAADYVKALTSSDVQIYWPYSNDWDGRTAPVITYAPEGDAVTNTGYVVREDAQGNKSVEEVVVDEEMALKRPVWVVNRNTDGGYVSLEMLRRQDPSFGEGGTILVGGGSNAPLRPGSLSSPGPIATLGSVRGRGPVRGPGGVAERRSWSGQAARPSEPESTKAENNESVLRTLVVKTLKANRNYDTWFAGASEFFFRCGSVESFHAKSEEEMRRYSPSVTEFMVVVRRSEIGKKLPFNAVLVSDWGEQLDNVAFLITEDDGGSMTTWKCTADVKVKSKTYGFNIEIPLNSRDDIVWRGSLARTWLEKYSDDTGRFGDMELTFEILGK